MSDAPGSPDPKTPDHSLRTVLWIGLGIVAALFALSGWAWTQLPSNALIPIHWNAAGKADGYGHRGMLFLMPGIVLGLSLFLYILPRFEPRRANLLASAKAYQAVWLATVLLLAGAHVAMVLVALGKTVPMERIIPGGVGLLFIVMGNVLGKVRSNFVFGVRTPWTLSSDLSWNKTHRLAGRLFVLFGLGMFLAALVMADARHLVWGMISFCPVILIVVAVYSYLVWRKDENRTNPKDKSSAQKTS